MIDLNFKEIGGRIKARRKAMGLTQKQLAQLVHLSEGSISRYEHGKVEDATTAKLTEFAKALRVDTAWLLGINVTIPFETRLIDIVRKAEGLPDKLINGCLDALEAQIDYLKEVLKNGSI